MRTILTLTICITFLLSFNQNIYSQVGIGTTTPNATAVLDVTSTTQGLLAPRMSTAQRTGITTPAEGLLVFDTDLDAFYYYDTAGSTWRKLLTDINERDNYVLVKSEADFPAASGGIITLDENTFYEINGTIVLTNSININGAYLAGLDTNEDILFRAGGTMFVGGKGGSMRNLAITASGGTVFNLDDTAHTETLVFQDNIIANSTSVGTIKGYKVVFSNVVQYTGNTAGIIYEDINSLLLSNQGWFADNGGSYETFVGTFDLIEKVSGFSIVNGANFGINVSSDPVVTSGIIIATVFTGTATNYVNKYTTVTNPVYGFTKEWFVDCPGIAIETDFVATGNLYVTTKAATNILASNTPVKMAGTTTALNLFRTTSLIDNRLTYTGTKTRYFSYTGSISVTASNNGKRFVFYIAKNGTVLPESEQSRKIANGADRGSISLSGVVELATNDYIEVWVENINDATDITAESMNLLLQ